MTDRYRSVVVESWLWQTILGLPEVVSAFGDQIVMDRISPESGLQDRTLEIYRHPGGETVRTLGTAGGVVMEGFVFDVSGWVPGHDTTPILSAMEAIDSALLDDEDIYFDGYSFVVDTEGELPPADPPRPGETPLVRLGKSYSVQAYA